MKSKVATVTAGMVLGLGALWAASMPQAPQEYPRENWDGWSNWAKQS